VVQKADLRREALGNVAQEARVALDAANDEAGEAKAAPQLAGKSDSTFFGAVPIRVRLLISPQVLWRGWLLFSSSAAGQREFGGQAGGWRLPVSGMRRPPCWSPARSVARC
jgi:hypothetical protein